MCNAYEQQVSYAQYRKAIEALELSTPSTESKTDVSKSDEIRIGDIGPVLRAAGNGVEIVHMRFGWPPPRPKAGPVFNFKSDKRHFEDLRRCVIILSGFFEFTGTKYPKTKHRFTLKGSAVMGIAGLWSEDDDGTLSFTMLTTALRARFSFLAWNFFAMGRGDGVLAGHWRLVRRGLDAAAPRCVRTRSDRGVAGIINVASGSARILATQAGELVSTVRSPVRPGFMTIVIVQPGDTSL